MRQLSIISHDSNSTKVNEKTTEQEHEHEQENEHDYHNEVKENELKVNSSVSKPVHV